MNESERSMLERAIEVAVVSHAGTGRIRRVPGRCQLRKGLIRTSVQRRSQRIGLARCEQAWPRLRHNARCPAALLKCLRLSHSSLARAMHADLLRRCKVTVGTVTHFPLRDCPYERAEREHFGQMANGGFGANEAPHDGQTIVNSGRG